MTLSTMDRRRFLATTAMLATTTALLADESDTETENANWIDAHSHIWTRDVKSYPLVAGQTVDDLAPPSFTADELLQLIQPTNVRRVVLIGHHIYYGFDNTYLLDAAEQHPDVFRVVAIIDDRAEDPAPKMRELLPRRATGFRITPLIHGDGWLDAPGMHAMWRCAAETRQAMCCLINPSHLAQVDAMCQQYPETPVVIDHFARIGIDGEIREADLNSLCRLARHALVRVKVSAFYALGKKMPPYRDLIPMIRRLYESFGAQRLMWASDAPYQLEPPNSYQASLELMQQLDFLSAEDRRWVMRGTAESVFFTQ